MDELYTTLKCCLFVFFLSLQVKWAKEDFQSKSHLFFVYEEAPQVKEP